MELPDLDLQTLSWVLVDVGALNWGVQEAFNVNLVSDYAPAEFVGLVYILVVVAGVVNLLDRFDLIDVWEDS